MDELTKRIRREIEKAGVISFARFMEQCLYCPEIGYYEKTGRSIGQRGDYYTGVATGSFFGEMLAWQLAQWSNLFPQQVQWLEAGAHTGQLAFDILSWVSQTYAELWSRLEYWILEPSSKRQGWQRERLDKFAGHIFWAEGFDGLPGGVNGIIFSNELLDAFPVHRLAWDAHNATWWEWGVIVRGESFAWQTITTKGWNDDLNKAGMVWPAEVMAVIPDGFTIEYCPSAVEWWRKAAKTLQEGKLMTIDYGLTEEELLSPERAGGTLRSYSAHHLSSDALANPGQQDITAHVNFTSLQRTGEETGLRTEGFLTQGQFLTRIAEEVWRSQSDGKAWRAKRIREFQTLTHPELLGRFRVLIQTR